MRRRILPFNLSPASWGLRGGQARAEAEAYYYCEPGEELDTRLAHIAASDSVDLERRLLDIRHRYRHISDYTYERCHAQLDFHGDDNGLALALIDIEERHGQLSSYDAALQRLPLLDMSDFDRELSRLKIEREHGHLTQTEFDKGVASLKNEPWVSIVQSSYDPSQGIEGVYFEFDWNQQWIDMLRTYGYIGNTDEQVIDNWFSDVCRAHVNADLGLNIGSPI